MLVVVVVLPAMEIGARRARLPRERRRSRVAVSPPLLPLLPLPFPPLSLPLLLLPAAPAAVPLGAPLSVAAFSSSSFFSFSSFFAPAAAVFALAAAAPSSSSSSSSSSDVAVGVLLGVAGARLPARDRGRDEVDRALGVDRDEKGAPAAGLEGHAFFVGYVRCW